MADDFFNFHNFFYWFQVRCPYNFDYNEYNCLKCGLILPTHESKTTQHKFNRRKGVGDEVLKLPIGIMQDNTQVSWLATRGLSPLPQGPWEQTQQHALYWGPNKTTNKNASLGSEVMLRS